MLLLIHTSKDMIRIGGTPLRVADYCSMMPDRGASGDIAVYDPSMIAGETKWQVPVKHQMEDPFCLMFETFRTGPEGCTMIMAQFSPDAEFYMENEIPPDSSFFFDMQRLHNHDFYELLYVIEGDVYQNIEHSRHYYPEGSCCFLNPNVYHTEENLGNQRLVFISLQKDYLEKLISGACYFASEKTESLEKLRAFLHPDQNLTMTGKEYIDFIPLETPEWVRTHVHDCIEKILAIMADPVPGASSAIDSCFLSLLSILFDPAHYRNAPMKFASSGEEQLFEAITGQIRQRKGCINRGELEQQLHYSGDYLYKIVRKFTGLSLSDYILEFRLEEAAAMLNSGKLPVSEIIRRTGFGNQTQFYRSFRLKYKVSPAQYRKRDRGNHAGDPQAERDWRSGENRLTCQSET